LGSRIYVFYHLYMGMGIILGGYTQCPTGWTAKLDYPLTFGTAHWSLLGAVVGHKAQEIIGGGAETW
jgi:hypothetical protein